MEILALTRYSTSGASSRFRFYQFIPFLEQYGWNVTVNALLKENYISFLYTKTPLPLFNIIESYFARVLLLLRKNRYDIIWLQQEAFPWIPAWFETALLKSNIPLVVDYDDAFFHRYDQHKSKIIQLLLKDKIDRVMNSADVVIAGNDYLAERAIKNNSKKVVILPTVVDIVNYKPVSHKKNGLFTIGWIGAPSTAKYIFTIQEALKEIALEDNVKIVFVGSGDIQMENVPVEIRKWDETTEVKEIQSFDVGIMPLDDTDWEKGKCGFKLIQYMACGKPVIGSPIGVNSKIIVDGENGYLANNIEEWIKYFRIIKNEYELRDKMGSVGRAWVEEKYSLQVIAPKLIQIFNNLIEERLQRNNKGFKNI
jgi:glycosyltransferase involved in cell wall biosynthesis